MTAHPGPLWRDPLFSPGGPVPTRLTLQDQRVLEIGTGTCFDRHGFDAVHPVSLP